MNCLILMGSPRKTGNTAALLEPFSQALTEGGVSHEIIWLYDQSIHPCVACRTCQADWTKFGCRYDDGMQAIFDRILACDLLILATPIYSWYCTPPMKAALDRLVYGMNKYYGGQRGPALWANKRVALIATCGYPPEKGADLFEAGMTRYCKHSQMLYEGLLCERTLGYDHVFMDDGKAERARAFARRLVSASAQRTVT